MVKSDATLVPPLSLMTCLITINLAGCCLFVYVQTINAPSCGVTVEVRAVRSVTAVPPVPPSSGSGVTTQTRLVSAYAGEGSPSVMTL
jgi:hypothetical protein